MFNPSTPYLKTIYDIAEGDIRKIYSFIDIYDNDYTEDDVFKYFLNISKKDYKFLFNFVEENNSDFEVIYNFLKELKINISNQIEIFKKIYFELKKIDKLELLSRVQKKFVSSSVMVYGVFLIEICFISCL